MATLAELQARRESLLQIKHSGINRSEHGESKLGFRSIAEIDKALADINQDILDAQGTPRRRLHYAYQTGKGL